MVLSGLEMSHLRRAPPSCACAPESSSLPTLTRDCRRAAALVHVLCDVRCLSAICLQNHKQIRTALKDHTRLCHPPRSAHSGRLHTTERTAERDALSYTLSRTRKSQVTCLSMVVHSRRDRAIWTKDAIFENFRTRHRQFESRNPNEGPH